MLTVIGGERPDALYLGIDGTQAHIVLTVGVATDTNDKALWITDLRGSVGLRPKQNVTLIRAVLDECAIIAKANGAHELRIEANSRKGWKQRLLPLLGFKPKRVGSRVVMRKVLTNG